MIYSILRKNEVKRRMCYASVCCYPLFSEIDELKGVELYGVWLD